MTHDGRGPAMLLEGSHDPLMSAIVSIGETVTISDRRHARTDYKLLRIKGDHVVMREESIFDARSFGGGMEHEIITIVVPVYRAE